MRHITILELLEELKTGMKEAVSNAGDDAGYLGQITEVLEWWTHETRIESGFQPELAKDLGEWYEIFEELMHYIVT